MLVRRLVDEILNLEGDLVVLVEEKLAVIVEPVECQVLDPDCLPLVL